MMRLTAPLDFMAVTDHSEWMAEMEAILEPGFEPSDSEAQALLDVHRKANTTPGGDYEHSIATVMQGMVSPQPTHESYVEGDPEGFKKKIRSMWAYMIETANKHYDPGTFTTFVGYEWSATPNGANLHRCVIFKGDEVPDTPFSYMDSSNAEDLWQWMEEVGGAPDHVLAIPHNANTSQGLMFLPQYVDGRPIDTAYAEKRSMMEPLTEIHQIKGNSETSPALAMNDEFADFEQIVGGSAWGAGQASPYSFVRDGLKEGLRQGGQARGESVQIRHRGLHRHPHGPPRRHRGTGLGRTLPKLRHICREPIAVQVRGDHHLDRGESGGVGWGVGG